MSLSRTSCLLAVLWRGLVHGTRPHDDQVADLQPAGRHLGFGDAGQTDSALADASRGEVLGIPRAEAKDCKKWLMDDVEVNLCFLSGGMNPAITGHKEQYGLQAWVNLLHGLPSNKCNFCGVAGIYMGYAEGTLMLTCQRDPEATGSKNTWPIEEFCVSYGQKMSQDTILVRTSSRVQFVKTTLREGDTNSKVGDVDSFTCDDGTHFPAVLNPVPKPRTDEPYGSKVEGMDAVVFTLKDVPANCWSEGGKDTKKDTKKERVAKRNAKMEEGKNKLKK